MAEPALVIRHQGVPERCEICHQADLFDPQTGICRRCQPVAETLAPVRIDPYSPTVPERFRRLIAFELNPNERLVWVGQPRNFKLALHKMKPHWQLLAIMLPMSFIGISAFGFKGEFLNLFFMPVILLAVFFLGLWGYELWSSQNTCYAVTNQRLMILGTGKKQTVISYTAGQIKRLAREQVSDGSGSLFFDELRTQNNQTEKVGFVGIPNVREVEATIRHNLLAQEKRR